MRQIREVLRLHHEAHLSERQIAHGCRLSRSTVQRYLERATTANLRWPLPESLDDTQLEQLLFPSRPAQAASEGRQAPKAQPDFTKVHQELKANRSVTLQLLWQEFMEEHPDGVHYSWFCEQYQEWARHLDVVLRQDHRAGEKTFVDHAGDTIGVIDPSSGQKRPSYVGVDPTLVSPGAIWVFGDQLDAGQGYASCADPLAGVRLWSQTTTERRWTTNSHRAPCFVEL